MLCLNQVGEDKESYKEIADKEKLTELQLRVRQLLDQVQQIQKEQNFQRLREERFRHTSESTNAKVFWWASIQVFVTSNSIITFQTRFLYLSRRACGRWNIWRVSSRPRNSSNKTVNNNTKSSETFLAFYLQVVMEIRTKAKHFTPEKTL